VDVLTNYDSTPEDVRNNVLAKLGECVMWQLVETYKPQLGAHFNLYILW